jgi:hypothetical protein
MKTRIAKKLSKALRSGKYIQAQEKLQKKSDDGKRHRCCLGVLCDLHSEATGKKWGTNKAGDRTYFGESTHLPKEVADWAGVKNFVEGESNRKEGLAGDLEFDGTSAITRNDSRGQSFEEIAAAIEADPEAI